jgi:hypothetical protein
MNNYVKEGEVLSPVLFNPALEFVSLKVQASLEGPKCTGTHRLLVCADNF